MVDWLMFHDGFQRGSIGAGHSLSAGRGVSNSGTHDPITACGSVPVCETLAFVQIRACGCPEPVLAVLAVLKPWFFNWKAEGYVVSNLRDQAVQWSRHPMLRGARLPACSSI